MKGWIEGMQNSISYIEDNLCNELDINDIAACSYVSAFHFQRIFSALCGITVGDYIRNRRLTLAAEELSGENAKVIDIAIKYGYSSPDSFTRAFQKFHGVLPSAARSGAELRSYAPLHIKITLEGGNIMEYKILEKSAFTVMGRARSFDTETSYTEIPKFWSEHFASPDGKEVCGMYGVCLDVDGKNFDYMIADNYIPWKEVPKGFITRTIPACTWAVFPCTIGTLQSVNTQMWSEWLPNCKEYKLGGNFNIELYDKPADDHQKTYTEIWLPVIKL